MKKNARAGLFIGQWTDLDGKKIRKIHRSEYGELYRLRRKYLVHALGVNVFGCRSSWHV